MSIFTYSKKDFCLLQYRYNKTNVCPYDVHIAYSKNKEGLYMIRILVVDDEDRFREFLKIFLKNEGFAVIEAKDGIEALKTFESQGPKIDLIILDVMMPILDGFEVLKRIRQNSMIPIIMLTAAEDETKNLRGYELGADDYIAKPVKTSILSAKIKRYIERFSDSAVLVYKDLKINANGRTIYVLDEKISAAPKEFDLLFLLASNQGRVFTRNEILDLVWGYDFEGSDRVVDSHIKKIRKKLDTCGHYIETLVSVGYKFEVK